MVPLLVASMLHQINPHLIFPSSDGALFGVGEDLKWSLPPTVGFERCSCLQFPRGVILEVLPGLGSLRFNFPLSKLTSPEGCESAATFSSLVISGSEPSWCVELDLVWGEVVYTTAVPTLLEILAQPIVYEMCLQVNGIILLQWQLLIYISAPSRFQAAGEHVGLLSKLLSFGFDHTTCWRCRERGGNSEMKDCINNCNFKEGNSFESVETRLLLSLVSSWFRLPCNYHIISSSSSECQILLVNHGSQVIIWRSSKQGEVEHKYHSPCCTMTGRRFELAYVEGVEASLFGMFHQRQVREPLLLDLRFNGEALELSSVMLMKILQLNSTKPQVHTPIRSSGGPPGYYWQAQFLRPSKIAVVVALQGSRLIHHQAPSAVFLILSLLHFSFDICG